MQNLGSVPSFLPVCVCDQLPHTTVTGQSLPQGQSTYYEYAEVYNILLGTHPLQQAAPSRLMAGSVFC
jgi:hypothetical protein